MQLLNLAKELALEGGDGMQDVLLRIVGSVVINNVSLKAVHSTRFHVV